MQLKQHKLFRYPSLAQKDNIQIYSIGINEAGEWEILGFDIGIAIEYDLNNCVLTLKQKSHLLLKDG